MKALILIGAILVVAGCAPFEDAYYLNREFARDSRAAWDAQVLYPDYRYADRQAEGLAGVSAEEIMNVRNQAFAERPTKSKAIEFGMGEAQ